jgi:hypothetical protein
MSPEQIVELVGRPYNLTVFIYWFRNSCNWYFGLVGLLKRSFFFSFHSVQVVDFKKPVYKEVKTVFTPYLQ